MYTALATVGFVLLLAGWAQRRRRERHVPLVVAGIAVDLALVLILEFSRDVIGLTLSETWTPVELAHIGFSILATVLYLPTIVLGVLLLRGREGVRKAHAAIATAALGCRAIGFVCMWFVEATGGSG